VVGGVCLGSAAHITEQQALALARRADVVFASWSYAVSESGCILRSVSLIPDLRQAGVLDAIHTYFREH
jgi:hypothetical protein